LRIAPDSLQIATLWRRSKVSWREVESIEFRAVNTYAFYGMVKASSSRVLSIRTRGGLLGTRKLELSRLFLDIDDAEYYALPDVMAQISQGRSAAESTSPAQDFGIPRMLKTTDVTPDPRHPSFARTMPDLAPQPAALTPPHDGPFDPDAALARYLAKKAAQETGEPRQHSEPRLNGEPIAATAPPGRPMSVGFGRKGL
jgi:hypothetical protein